MPLSMPYREKVGMYNPSMKYDSLLLLIIIIYKKSKHHHNDD